MYCSSWRSDSTEVRSGRDDGRGEGRCERGNKQSMKLLAERVTRGRGVESWPSPPSSLPNPESICWESKWEKGRKSGRWSDGCIWLSTTWIQKGHYEIWLDEEWLWSLHGYFLTCEIWEYWRDGWQLVFKSWDVVGVSSCSCRGHPSQSSSPVFCIVWNYQLFNCNVLYTIKKLVTSKTLPSSIFSLTMMYVSLNSMGKRKYTKTSAGFAINIWCRRKTKHNAVVLTCASWACCIFCWRNMKPGKLLLKPYPDQLEVGVRGEASTCSFIAVRVKSFKSELNLNAYSHQPIMLVKHIVMQNISIISIFLRGWVVNSGGKLKMWLQPQPISSSPID